MAVILQSFGSLHGPPHLVTCHSLCPQRALMMIGSAVATTYILCLSAGVEQLQATLSNGKSGVAIPLPPP